MQNTQERTQTEMPARNSFVESSPDVIDVSSINQTILQPQPYQRPNPSCSPFWQNIVYLTPCFNMQRNSEMGRRLSRENSRESKGSMAMQKRIVENRLRTEPVPDLTDFMNDMFFGTLSTDMKVYNLTGKDVMNHEEESFDDSRRSNSSSSTQEWLEEARRMVASSPSRCDSPSRLAGSPRFALAQGGQNSTSFPNRRDPLSRSARRNRVVESFSGEIISKSAKHTRNGSEILSTVSCTNPEDQTLADSAVHKWLSNILNLPNPTPSPPQSPNSRANFDPTSPSSLPLRQSVPRKSRFQTDPSSPGQNGIPVPPGRTVKNPTQLSDTQLLSPPKHLVESAHRRSASSATCSVEKILVKSGSNGLKKEEVGDCERSLNGFLKAQRIKIEKILSGEVDAKANIVLSGPSNSTSSMVAAICYSWLQEKGERKNKGEESVVVPVMNMKRRRMWKQRQAAWLFHHVGLDSTSLLFLDEMDLETLMMAGRLSILVVGQDILRTTAEAGSQCTILTDNYCEDDYDLLQTPLLNKLLLAGILLETKNLDASSQSSMTRDAQAVQLLLVGSAPSYRDAFFDKLMQEQRDNSFLEALRHNYGMPPTDGRHDSGMKKERISEKKLTAVSQPEDILQNSDRKPNDSRSAKTDADPPNSAKASAFPVQAATTEPDKGTTNGSRGKNKFFLAKWFGWGSK